MTVKGIYEKARRKWGRKAQLMVTVEELAELAKEVSKLYRGVSKEEDLLSEIADVEIMIDQVLYMQYDIVQPKKRKRIKEIKHEKIERLRKALEE